MAIQPEIPGFGGELIVSGDPAYDEHREVWNAVVDRRPAAIARCRSERDVAAAIAFGRREGLEIAVKCGGHSILGLSVPEGGLMIDLTPMGSVRVDAERRQATVGGGALLRGLDRTAAPYDLATTAGNVSHTGVGGLTLGGGMGWLARQFGLACDNVERYTVVTADGDVVRATSTENADLFWGLRGGGGNFGIVTEFEFRLHPTTGRALVVELDFEADEAVEPMRRWRDLLADALRPATLTADVGTASDASGLPSEFWGRSVASLGYIWVGEMDEARRYLTTMRSIGRPLAERVTEMAYVDLQSIADDRHHHGRRRYSKGHYLASCPTLRSKRSCHEACSMRGPPTGRAWPTAASRPTAGRSPTSARMSPRSAIAGRWSSSWAAGAGSSARRTPIESPRRGPTLLRWSRSRAGHT